MNILMSEESVHELDEFLNSVRSMVDTSGHLYKGVDSVRSTKYAFFCMSYKPLDGGKDLIVSETSHGGSSGM